MYKLSLLTLKTERKKSLATITFEDVKNATAANYTAK